MDEFRSGHEVRTVSPVRAITRLPYPKHESSAEAEAAFVRYLTNRDLSPDLAALNGWYPTLDGGDDVLRIVIPASNSLDYPYWQARAIPAVPSEARYLSPNVPRTDSVIIVWPGKSRTTKPGVVAVVEGPMDALAAAGTGVVGVATMGGMPPTAVYSYLARLFHGKTMIVIPDRDMQAAGSRSVRELRERGIAAWLRLLPASGKDLCALSPRRREIVVNEL